MGLGRLRLSSACRLWGPGAGARGQGWGYQPQWALLLGAFCPCCLGHFVPSLFFEASVQGEGSALQKLLHDLRDSHRLPGLFVIVSPVFLLQNVTKDCLWLRALSRKPSLGLEIKWFEALALKLYYSFELLSVFGIVRFDAATQNLSGVSCVHSLHFWTMKELPWPHFSATLSISWM